MTAAPIEWKTVTTVEIEVRKEKGWDLPGGLLRRLSTLVLSARPQGSDMSRNDHDTTLSGRNAV